MEYTLITGASGGIGKALAQKLAERKHNLVLVSRNSGTLSTLCQELTQKYKTDVCFIAADLSRPNAAQQIFDETQKQGLKISMLINNAGIGSSGEFTDIDLQSELNMLQLNITSLVSLSHLFLSEMKKSKKGVLLNVASLTSFMPVPYMASYAASKAFVRSFTESLSREYKPHGIHVMLLCPGLTRTNFNQAAGLNSEKASALSSDYKNTSTQTPEAVAIEALQALDKKKHSHISGSMNRLGVKLLALIPNTMITKFMSQSYRKKLKQNL